MGRNNLREITMCKTFWGSIIRKTFFFQYYIMFCYLSKPIKTERNTKSLQPTKQIKSMHEKDGKFNKKQRSPLLPRHKSSPFCNFQFQEKFSIPMSPDFMFININSCHFHPHEPISLSQQPNQTGASNYIYITKAKHNSEEESKYL